MIKQRKMENTNSEKVKKVAFILYNVLAILCFLIIFSKVFTADFEVSLKTVLGLLIVFGPLFIYLGFIVKRLAGSRKSNMFLLDYMFRDLGYFLLLCIYWLILFFISLPAGGFG